MKRWALLLGILILVLGALTIVQAEEKNGSWNAVLRTGAKHPTNMAAFLNEKMGLTIGYGGEVHYSADGGQSWPTAKNNSLCRFGLDFANDKVIWNCGNGGQIRISTDGGENWNYATGFGLNEPEHCRFLSVLDEKIAWIGSPFSLAATLDGGKTWNELELPGDCKDVAAIALRTTNAGYVIDVTGKLFATADGGQTWTTHTLPAKGVKFSTLKSPTAAVRFMDEKTGIVVVSAKEGTVAFDTADGGKTWTKTMVAEKLYGFLYLAHDGRTLTVTSKQSNLSDGREEAFITVLRR